MQNLALRHGESFLQKRPGVDAEPEIIRHAYFAVCEAASLKTQGEAA